MKECRVCIHCGRSQGITDRFDDCKYSCDGDFDDLFRVEDCSDCKNMMKFFGNKSGECGNPGGFQTGGKA